jgi:hypothetical protein
MEPKDLPDTAADVTDTSGREREPTFGEKAVGLAFNPSGNEGVDLCKQKFAAAIDLLNDLRNSTENGEQKRMLSVAITEAQTAQMWAVKAITWKY